MVNFYPYFFNLTVKEKYFVVIFSLMVSLGFVLGILGFWGFDELVGKFL